MAHRKAKLTPLGRQLLVERITELGWSVAAAAESMGVSRQTAYKWLARYRAEGTTGLSDRRSRPHRSPRQCAARLVAQILELRRARRFGPHRIGYALQVARSTVYAVLVRAGLNRLSGIDRPTRQVVRYQRERAGELVHVDVKRLARIPQAAGTESSAAQASATAAPAPSACTRRSTTTAASPTSRCTPTSAVRPAPASCAAQPPSSPAWACRSRR